MENVKQILREFNHEIFEKYDSNYRYNYAGFVENDDFGSYTRLYTVSYTHLTLPTN